MYAKAAWNWKTVMWLYGVSPEVSEVSLDVQVQDGGGSRGAQRRAVLAQQVLELLTDLPVKQKGELEWGGGSCHLSPQRKTEPTPHSRPRSHAKPKTSAELCVSSLCCQHHFLARARLFGLAVLPRQMFPHRLAGKLCLAGVAEVPRQVERLTWAANGGSLEAWGRFHILLR